MSSKPVVLVVLEDNELKTQTLGDGVTVVEVDLDALLGDGSGAAEKLEELQSLPANTVDQWKLRDVEQKLREIISDSDEDEDFDDEEDFDEEEFDEDDFGDEDEEEHGGNNISLAVLAALDKRWTPDEDRLIAEQAAAQSDAEEEFVPGPVS